MTISLVAGIDGKVVELIAFSPITIDGNDLQWFTLGPVAVLLSMQKKVIGKALVNEGLKSLRALGAGGCMLVGDPAYYTRLAFVTAPR